MMYPPNLSSRVLFPEFVYRASNTTTEFLLKENFSEYYEQKYDEFKINTNYKKGNFLKILKDIQRDYVDFPSINHKDIYCIYFLAGSM